MCIFIFFFFLISTKIPREDPRNLFNRDVNDHARAISTERAPSPNISRRFHLFSFSELFQTSATRDDRILRAGAWAKFENTFPREITKLYETLHRLSASGRETDIAFLTRAWFFKKRTDGFAWDPLSKAEGH